MKSQLEVKGLRLIANHILRAQGHMQHCMNLLNIRAVFHDQSKYSDEELGLVLGKSYYDSLEYMSDEERNALDLVQPALEHHYANNSHHPEFYEDGILGMSLLDLIELMCDWKAASETSGKNSSFENSIAFGRERFEIPPELVIIIENTAKELGWIK